jgi:hypothetical protein
MYDSYDMGEGNWGTSREQIQSTICVLMYGELVPGFLFKDLFDVVKVVITSENNLVAY